MRLLGNTFKEDFNAFLKDYALWICVAVAVIIVATIIILFVIKNRKVDKKAIVVDNNEWLVALGGKDNITEVSATGSRLNVSVKDKEVLDKEKLVTLGVTSMMTMSNKVILVIEDKAEQIAASINKEIK